MTQKKMNKTPIAAGLSLILGSMAMNPVYAADADNDPDASDDIVVTVVGIKGSLTSSMNTKRDSVGVVDAITSEDIGKFPDTNLAESLQRITGVSISRANGEGSKVTVRGFGPQFNNITLNGRTMPAAEIAPNWDSDTRAFSFENLSSDGVSAVEVYKTGRANISSGGIGATVNILTAKPLDKPGTIMSFGAKANHDTTVHDGSSVTPEVSGIMSWTNDDETFGVSLNANMSDRDSGTAGAEVAQWRVNNWDGNVPGADGFPVAPTYDNAPGTGGLYALPSNLIYSMSDVYRERTNAQLTLQFQATDNVRATLDYTYANLKSDEYKSEMSIWMENYISAVTFNNDVSASPVIYRESRYRNLSDDAGGLDPRDMAFTQMNINSNTDNKSVGFTVDWDINDNFTVKFDAHSSEAEATPTRAYGNRMSTGIGANVLDGQGANYTTGLPLIVINFDDCNAARGLNCNNMIDQDDVGTSIMQRDYNTTRSEVDQVRIDAEYAFEEFTVDFGIESRSLMNNGTRANNNFTMGNWGVENPGELPAGYLTPVDFANVFNDYSTEGGWTQGFRADPRVIGAWAANNYGFDMNSVMGQSLNRTIEEDIDAYYVQVTTDGMLGEMAYNLRLGVRYEDTTSTSTSDVAPPAHILWESNNDFRVIAGSGNIAYSVSNEYSHTLPNLDIDLELAEDVVGRFSYSKTIARPAYSQLSSAAAINGGPSAPTILAGAQPAGASSGNPALVPLESENIDLSVEWYFDESSYLSVGYYTKDVENFVGTAPVLSDFYGLRDASSGPRAQAALDALNAANITVNETTLFSMMAAMQLGVAYDSMTAEEFEAAVDIVPNSDDPLMQFLFQSPVNNKSATIDGFEIAFQHFFGDSGFGVQANYTTVDGDIGFDLSSTETQFALLGLSDTANLVAIYEKDKLHARLTYNWRDKFLNNAAHYSSEPEFVEEYSQIDLSVGYQVNDNLSVSFDAINLAEDNRRTHGRSVNQLWRLDQYGARYSIGARYTF